jgi:hypothetical protein
MNLQRKLTLIATTGAVALSAGHFVQKQADNRLAEGNLPPDVVISSVTPVAAGPEAISGASPAYLPPIMDTAAVPPIPTLPEEQAPPAVEMAQGQTTVAPETDLSAVTVAATPSTSEIPVPAIAAVDATNPLLAPPAPAAVQEADSCSTQLDLIPQPGAMIGLTLLAPCHPDERVVLRHAGLAVTGKTSASGALFATIPALTAVAQVEVMFPSGEVTSAQVGMPEITKMQRFIVQWQDGDAFQLHGFENGAGYDQPGHVSASYPGKAGEGAFLTLLGDSTTDLPLLAEAYTFGPDTTAQIVLEAAVTEATCGREILGETIMAADGSVEITDLSLAMPDCSAVGDILVLKNLVQDMKLAAAN